MRSLVKRFPPNVPLNYYRPHDVARWLGVKRDTIRIYFDVGKLEGYRNPKTGDRLVSRESLWKFCLKNKILIPEIGLYPFSAVALGLDHPTANAIAKAVKSRDSLVEIADNQTHFAILASRGNKVCGIVDSSIGTANTIEIGREIRRHAGSTNMVMLAIASEDRAPPPDMISLYDRVFRRPFDVKELTRCIVKAAKEYQQVPSENPRETI